MILVVSYIAGMAMRNSYLFFKFFLWMILIVVVFAMHMMFVFFVSGLLMAIFQLEDGVVRLVYAYFSLPLSVILTIAYSVRNRASIQSYIDSSV